MTDANVSDDAQLQALVAELEAVAQRFVGRVFGARAPDTKPLKPLSLPNFQPLIVRHARHLWEADRPTEALEWTLRQAISKLEGTFGATPARPGSITKKEAALRYFNLDGSPDLPHVKPVDVYDASWERKGGKFYNRILSALREAANLDRGESTVGTHLRKLRRELAEIVLHLDAFSVEEHASVSVPRPQQSKQYVSIVDRPEYINRLQELVDAGHRVICIWGEPGTGKTTLAEQFSRRLAHGMAAPIIRYAPMLTAPVPEAEIFQQDLANVLAAEGVDPFKLDKAMWFTQLCEQLSGQPRNSVIILDNVEMDGRIEQIVGAQPKIPVIMTMRVRPTHQKIVCEELGNFTEYQALDFIKRRLPDENEGDAKALGHVLGYRPLALEHAVRFVRESPGYGLRELVQDLATEVADTLKDVTPGEAREHNLSKLYGLILTSLEQDDAASAVLDSFLAVVGGSGIGYREVVYLFMQSEAGGAHAQRRLWSGLHELGRLGLVRQQQGVISRKLEAGGSAEQPIAELAMHTLTYRILRDLRGSKLFAIESKYWDWVQQGGHQALPDDGTSDNERAYLALMQWQLRAVSGGMPPGWAWLVLADRQTWIALKETHEGDLTGTYIVRYAVQPNNMYKLDYRTGRWSSIDNEERVLLYLLVTIYYERIHNGLQNERLLLTEEEPDADGESQPAQPRLDDEITPSDGYRHILIEALTPEYLNRGWRLWVLCGKRFVPSPGKTGPICPECDSLRNSAERLRDIETALRQRYFTRLDYKDPDTATHLFLTRAKLRRKLERPLEAADDLDRAYRFLLITQDTPEGDVVTLGMGLIREAWRLPEPHRQLAVRTYDHLVWRLKDCLGPIRPVLTGLMLGRARLLASWGQTADALAGYQAIVDGVDAGALDASGTSLFGVFWEKEHAERKLGHVSQANASLLRAVEAAEHEYGEGGVLAGSLVNAGIYLTRENPRQARQDLCHALRIAREQQPPNYEIMWRALRQLGVTEHVLGSVPLALEALEQALQLARDHMPHWVENTEEAIAQVRGAGS
jgi:tetratricopeptide (TPR) repeat protein